MIAHVRGELLQATETTAIVATEGGVGYEISCPTPVLAKLPAPGGQCALWVHTNVSEKAIDLYGFASADEREVFRTLISIDKLGPKKALGILSHFEPDHLREIAFREDAGALSAVPGIGPKSARQILWFLKDKIDKLGAGLRAGGKDREAAPSGPQGEYFDALAGLKGLGYAEDEVRSLLKGIFAEQDDLDAAGAIRLALKQMAAGR